MKLPDVCVKIRTGQVWQKRDDLVGRRAQWRNPIVPQILITGKARSRHGNIAWHTARYDMFTRVGHAITEKDIWRFYILLGTDSTVKPLQNEHLRQPTSTRPQPK